MTTSTLGHWLPLTGVLAAVIAAADLVLPTVPEELDDQFVGEVVAGGAGFLLAVALKGYFAVVVVLFAVSVRQALRSGEASPYSGIAYAGGILVAASSGATAMMGWALHDAAHGQADQTALTLGYLLSESWIPWLVGMTCLLFGSGLGGLRTGVLPRWLGVISLVLAAAGLTGLGGIVVYLLTPLWLASTGLVLFRRARVPTPGLRPPAPAGRG